MCYSVIVVKQVCRYGHINDIVVCWRQCVRQLEESIRTKNYNRLCLEEDDKLQELELKLVKSHAVRRNTISYGHQCLTCEAFENVPQCPWTRARDQAEQRKSELDALWRSLRVSIDNLGRSKSASNSPASQQLRRRVNYLYSEIDEAEERHAQSLRSLEIEAKTAENLRITHKQFKDLELLALSEFYGRQTRKFFLGRITMSEETFDNFGEGDFDESLISDFGMCDESSHSSEGVRVGVDGSDSPVEGRNADIAETGATSEVVSSSQKEPDCDEKRREQLSEDRSAWLPYFRMA